LDTLFSYISESDSAALFSKKIKEYNEDSKLLSDNLTLYNDLHNNSHKMEMIQKKNEKIHEINKKIRMAINEYKNTEYKQTLRNAVELYIHDLMPEIDNLRRLKYDINEIIVDDDNNEVLFQREVGISKIEHIYGEQPVVSKFKMN
jgi:hypothetical protein